MAQTDAKKEQGREVERKSSYDVVVVGGGPSGATAAVYAARAGWSTLVIDKGVGAGALGMAHMIANYPGIGETVTGADLVGRIRAQAAGFGASFVTDRVTAANLSETRKTLHAAGGEYSARAVIVATGSMGRERSIPGEERLVGRGVSYCATCDGFFFQDRPVVVVGNNDEAVDEALYVARFASHVVLLVPTARFRAGERLVEEAESHPQIELRFSTHLREILGDEFVRGAAVTGGGGGEETIETSGVFIYLQGGRPIVDFLGGQVPTTQDGCLKVDATFQTEVPGVFAAGDVLCKHLKQAVIAAAEGASAASSADRYLSGRTKLQPDWS